jgi:Uma2 family endonuclease
MRQDQRIAERGLDTTAALSNLAGGRNSVLAALQFMWPMATTARTRMTVEEFLAISERDPRRMELIDGEIFVVSEPRLAHGVLQAMLIGALAQWDRRAPGRARVAGPTGVHLGPHDAYGPDVLVFGARPRVDSRGYLDELPLICVEIRSPTTWRNDIGRKKSVYEARGVPELWLVDDVAGVVLVFRRSAPGVGYYDTALELDVTDTLASPLLPGFELALSELFAQPRT